MRVVGASDSHIGEISGKPGRMIPCPIAYIEGPRGPLFRIPRTGLTRLAALHAAEGYARDTAAVGRG